MESKNTLMEQCNGIGPREHHNESPDKLIINAERQRRKQKGSLMLSYCVKGKGMRPSVTLSLSHI